MRSRTSDLGCGSNIPISCLLMGFILYEVVIIMSHNKLINPLSISNNSEELT